MHVGVDGVAAQLAAVLVLLGLRGVDLGLRVGDLLGELVELDLRAVGLLGVALDRVVELVDLGGDGVGLRLLVADGIADAACGSTPTTTTATIATKSACARRRRPISS